MGSTTNSFLLILVIFGCTDLVLSFGIHAAQFNHGGQTKIESLEESTISRRFFLSGMAWLGVSGTTSFAFAAEPSTKWGASPNQPVVVLGAGGRTGMEVVQALAKEKLYTVTMTRTGRDPFQVIKLKDDVKSFISHFSEPVSVISENTLREALVSVKASAIVYCASASKAGGTAFEVDDDGVAHAAEIARDLGARFILVSALALDRPESKSYQITNSIGGNFDKIMDAKREGEVRTRSILAKNNDYVIIRPGVLLSGKTRNGAADLEVNQGDTIGGGLSRDEVAGIVVGALKSGKTGTTVEVYRTSTHTKLQPEFIIPSGGEIYSDTYTGFFATP